MDSTNAFGPQVMVQARDYTPLHDHFRMTFRGTGHAVIRLSV
jgi:hypothetical protein